MDHGNWCGKITFANSCFRRFRWVCLQLDYLCTLHNGPDIDSRLGRLPRKLGDSYAELWAQETKSYEEEDMNRLGLALSLLLVPNLPTPAVFARFVFGDDDDNEDCTEIESTTGQILVEQEEGRSQVRKPKRNDPLLEMVTRLCFGLVIFDRTTNSFRFAHTSVQEYVRSRKDEYESLSESCARIAKRCMSVLVEPESVVDSIHVFTNRLLWPEQGGDKQLSTMFPTGNYIDRAPKCSTIDWVSTNWAYYFANSKEIRKTQYLKELDIRLQNSVDEIPWELLNPSVFFSACSFQHLQLVQRWLNCYPKLALLRQDVGDSDAFTALHYAAYSDSLDVSVCLINAGADINAGKMGRTPLGLAISGNSPRVLQLLIERGARVHGRSHETMPVGTVPDLMTAIYCDVTDNGECVRVLLKAGADPRVMNQDFNTPLGISTILNRKNLVQIFLDFGVDANDPITESGGTSLMASVSSHNDEVTKLLLDAGADLNITSLYGTTALMTAAKYGNLGAIKTLLPLTTNLNNQSIDAKTALYMAAEQGHQATVEALLDTGAEIQPQEPGPHCPFMDPSERVQGFARSALVSALQSRHEAIFRMMLELSAKDGTKVMGPVTYKNVQLSLMAGDWDSFNAAKFREVVLARIRECRAKGESEEDAHKSILAKAKNPFCRFAMILMLEDMEKNEQHKEFSKHSWKRAYEIIRQRNEKIAEKVDDLYISK